jgi:hypothetical protein
MAMTNMKMSASEAKEYSGDTIASDSPEYPYGLCIRLDDDALEKLGITALPAIGTEMMVMAKVIVKSTSAYSRQGGEDHKDVELQITDLELGQASASGDAATALYGA